MSITLRTDIPVTLVKHVASDGAVVGAARVSTAGADAEMVSDPSDAGLINFLLKNRHGSPFEHNSFTFRVTAPIFVWREHMRHRVGFSYNEESGRYKQLDPVFYVPGEDRPLVQEGKPGHYRFVAGDEGQVREVRSQISLLSARAYGAYQTMLDEGIAREVARMVLPVNIYSTAYVTCNARSLMNFLSLRTKDEGSAFPSYPQHEIEVVARQYENLWRDLMPLTHAAFTANRRVAP